MNKNLKSQILSGYLFITIIPILITLITIVYGNILSNEIKELSNYRAQQNATKDAIVGHYSWLSGLSDTLLTGSEFKGSLDPTTCALGKWMSEVKPQDLEDPEIKKAIETLKGPHNEIHNSAKALIELSKTDPDAAYAEYSTVIKPKVTGIIAEITVVTNRYKEFAEADAIKLQKNIFSLRNMGVVLIFIGIVASYLIGNSTSKRIVRPVSMVAEWSKNLALGDNALNFNGLSTLNLPPENEIAQMVASFESMAKSIQKNVAVVERVANGDLTAFVDIRSNMDVLGQALYRMVQENDHMFANILGVSSNVAEGANEISKASAILSEHNAQQAATVEEITSSVMQVTQLTAQNSKSAENVLSAIGKINTDVHESAKKMDELVRAVAEIKDASDKISSVIKSIDDISFQTNILSLNASIEAARAGNAGKGFAVVAGEVRELALKSATAAKETKALIENTITKTHYGTRVAGEANETFAGIEKSIIQTIDHVQNIALTSKEQSEAMTEVSNNIQSVAHTAILNAEFSEKTASASQYMYKNSSILRVEMGKFNLRRREQGKPFIPKEKENDEEFIRIATENYQKSLDSGIATERRLTLK